MINVNEYFSAAVADVGEVTGKSEWKGIFAPKETIGDEKFGVTQQFIRNAGTYHKKYLALEHFANLINGALTKIGYAKADPVILDIGSGSGNTVFPALDRFPNSNIVATDISENLLAILRDQLATEEKYKNRVGLVCVDVTQNHFAENSFDLVIGAAILHHLLDPRPALEAVCSALKPGGYAIFFEPFEYGSALLRVAYGDIVEQAMRRAGLDPGEVIDGRYIGVLARKLRLAYMALIKRSMVKQGGPVSDIMDGAVINFLKNMILDYTCRSGSDKPEHVFAGIDDKWLFTKSYFEGIATDMKFRDCVIYPLSDTVAPFTTQTEVNLRLGLGAGKDALPRWAWDILKKYDDAFSAEVKREFFTEGCIILQK